MPNVDLSLSDSKSGQSRLYLILLFLRLSACRWRRQGGRDQPHRGDRLSIGNLSKRNSVRALDYHLPCCGVLVGMTVFLVLSVGCEQSDHWDRMPVTGQVTLDGKPWSGSMTLRPVRPVRGPTTSVQVLDGSFRFSTSDGPVAGRHQAILMPKSEFGRPDASQVETLVDVPTTAPFELQIDFESPPMDNDDAEQASAAPDESSK